MRPLALALVLALVSTGARASEPVWVGVPGPAVEEVAPVRLPTPASDAPLDVIMGTLDLKGGARVVVEGGCYLPESRCIAKAQELADLETQNRKLTEALLLLSGATLAVAVAAASIGYAFGKGRP